MAVHRQLSLCLRLRHLREQAGLTQYEVADCLSVSQAAYSRMEKGQTELKVQSLFDISEFYNIPLVDLLKGI